MQRLIGTVVVVMLLQLLVNGVLLWLICKLFRRDALPVTFRRALLTAIPIFLINFVSGAAFLYTQETMPGWAGLVLGLVVVPVLLVVLLRFSLRKSFAKAFLVFLCWMVGNIAASIAMLLLLKMFLMEAFVIPTGNMAEALRGDHKEIECPTCGIRFAVNAAGEAQVIPGEPGRVVNGCACPNCRRNIRLVNPERDRRQPRSGIIADERSEYVETLDPGVKGGDRMIVGKGWLAGSGFPQRMEPFVFKYPDKPDMIYVKRLVGLPGETIAIHGGDLYRLAPEDSPKYQDKASPEELRKPEFMHADDEQAVELFRKGKFQIIRKSPAQVLSTMQLVYDNDYPAQDLTAKNQQRWLMARDTWGMSSDGKRFFHDFPDMGPGIEGTIEYHHRLRGNDAHGSLITDFTAYNTNESLLWDAPSQQWRSVGFDWGGKAGVHWVGDLILECKIDITDAMMSRGNNSWTFALELIRAGEGFRVVWDDSAGTCELWRDGFNGRTEKIAQQSANLSKGEHSLRFANVDQRLIVWQDDKLIFGDGVDYSPRKTSVHPFDRKPASIKATVSFPTVSNIRLHRDAYVSLEPARPDVNVEDWSDPGKHPGLEKLPVRTMYVQPGHYFCLGDNSMASSDSRSWGVVPERLLLGKALLRYYPWPRVGRLH